LKQYPKSLIQPGIPALLIKLVKKVGVPDLGVLPEREGVVELLIKPLKRNGRGGKVKFDKPVIQ
jgi:hypothetical protein